MANPELGAKQVCPNCQAKFYDLNKRPAHCPKCETDFDPEDVVKSRRIRARAITPEAETDEEAEDKVAAKGGDEDEEEEEEAAAPELDEVVADDAIIVSDDDEEDGAEGGKPDADVDLGVGEEETLDDEDDDSVPFIDDEDEDDLDDEIEGIGKDDED
jgi:uncharacterized protein (TIGR02300 family)